jgi:hypothetical protein
MSDELKERNTLKLILIVRFACATLDMGHPIYRHWPNKSLSFNSAHYILVRTFSIGGDTFCQTLQLRKTKCKVTSSLPMRTPRTASRSSYTPSNEWSGKHSLTEPKKWKSDGASSGEYREWGADFILFSLKNYLIPLQKADWHYSHGEQGVEKIIDPLLYPHALIFMLIHICRAINDDTVKEFMVMNFLKYNCRSRKLVLNFSSWQNTLSTIDGERNKDLFSTISGWRTGVQKISVKNL